MALRGDGLQAESEPVLLAVEDGRLRLVLDDGDVVSFDLAELQAEIAVEQSADHAEPRSIGDAA
jgi:hypothetical protein